jgi:L-iditol 2-dehydrogenase
MRAALYTGVNEIVISEIEKPEPGAGELRVKLSKVGICGSDVHIFLGHRKVDFATVLGHEGLGYVEKLGEGVSGRMIGERVVIEPNIPCCRCSQCLKGRGNICENKRVIGLTEAGCFAEYVCVPEEFCWAVPEGITDEDAVTVEPMAVAYHALFCSKALPGDSIAVIGLGAIGLLLTHLALKLGYKVIVTEINKDKVKLAVDQGALASNVSGSQTEQTMALAQIWRREEVVAVFECAGSAFTASLATGAAPRGSEIVLVGLAEQNATFQPLKIAREEISIVPSIIYNHPFDFKRVLNMIEGGTLKPGFVISEYIKLENIKEGLILAAEGNSSKIVVNIS